MMEPKHPQEPAWNEDTSPEETLLPADDAEAERISGELLRRNAAVYEELAK